GRPRVRGGPRVASLFTPGPRLRPRRSHAFCHEGHPCRAGTGPSDGRGDPAALSDLDILPEDTGPVRVRARREPDAGRAPDQPRRTRGREVRALVLERHGRHHDVPHPPYERSPLRRYGRLIWRRPSYLYAILWQSRLHIAL